MAYDLNRCPQNELPEFRDYFYTLIQRTIGTSAHDFKFVLTNSNIPPGFGPGEKANATYPLFGLTQQFSNGPKGRIFLPSELPDENGYFTRCIQYLDDARGTRAKLAREGSRGRWEITGLLLAEDFEYAKSDGGLVWAWYYVAGNEYAPVEGAYDGETEPPIIVVPGGGLSAAEVQAMINESLEPVYAEIDKAVKIGDSIGLRMNSGKVIGVVSGGPNVDDQPIELIAKTNVHAWESLKVEQGE